MATVAERLQSAREGLKRAKALKLLEAMVEPCEHQQKSGEHDWRKCRRCLAHCEAERAHGIELLAVLLALLRPAAGETR